MNAIAIFIAPGRRYRTMNFVVTIDWKFVVAPELILSI